MLRGVGPILYSPALGIYNLIASYFNKDKSTNNKLFGTTKKGGEFLNT
jgi:hypothetical protein